MSEDPIGLSGGDFNFYRYVKNKPMNRVDPLGLEGASMEIRDPDLMNQSTGAQVDFIENYLKMRDVNTHGADKYYHCMANCQAAKRGKHGARSAEIISNTREMTDRLKGDSEIDCKKDQEANLIGREAGFKASLALRPVAPLDLVGSNS